MSWQPLLDWWFGDWNDREPIRDGDPEARRWWSGSPAVDAEIRDRLEDEYRRAREGQLSAWRETTGGTLALVLLLDQVPRSLFRTSAEAFATDARAQEITLDAIHRGLDRQLPPIQRAFLYMPFMHAEDLVLQDRGVALFEALARDTEGLARAGYYRGAHQFAVKHRDLIARFGRFPHRNAVLGRESTPGEEAFLAEHGRGY